MASSCRNAGFKVNSVNLLATIVSRRFITVKCGSGSDFADELLVGLKRGRLNCKVSSTFTHPRRCPPAFDQSALKRSTLSPATLGGVCERVRARPSRCTTFPPVPAHTALFVSVLHHPNTQMSSAHFQSCLSGSLGLAKLGHVVSNCLIFSSAAAAAAARTSS